MVINEIAVPWAIANIGNRFDPLRFQPIANDRKAACKPAKSGAPCWLKKHNASSGIERPSDTASASASTGMAELRSGSAKPAAAS